jgi:hypothetical protein
MKRKQTATERQLNKIMLQYAKIEPDKELANDWMLEEILEQRQQREKRRAGAQPESQLLLSY